MELQTHPSNLLIMDATAMKDLLHLRIEQADEKMLSVLAQLTESLFKSFQPEVIEETEELVDDEEVAFAEEMKNAPAPPWAKPVTREQFNAEIKESLDQYHRGEYFTLEEIEQGTVA